MPCTLVRLAGCPLRCDYCDTPEALPARSGEITTIEDIRQRVADHALPLTLVTGGEPLAQLETPMLLEALLGLGGTVQLETSGAFDITVVPRGVRRIVDIKTPGSGEEPRNLWANLRHLSENDEIKFVITGREDFDWCVACIRQHRLAELGIPLLISPVHQRVDLRRLCRWILDSGLPLRLQPQLHKWIWGADASGV